jgi:hypothetical protein
LIVKEEESMEYETVDLVVHTIIIFLLVVYLFKQNR